MVTEAIFLANAGGTHLHDLGGRQIQGRRHQEPRLVVPRHRDDKDMYRNFWPTDRPSAPPVSVPERAAPALHPGPASPPRDGPVHMVLRGREPLTPLRPTTSRLGSGHHWVIQPCIDPQPRQHLYPPFPRTRVQTGFNDHRHRVRPNTHAHDRRARLHLHLPQQPHGLGRCGLKGLADWQRGFPTIPPCRMGQIHPRGTRDHIAHDDPVVGSNRLRPIRTTSAGCIAVQLPQTLALVRCTVVSSTRPGDSGPTGLAVPAQ